ncbi:hypothetical protein JOD57_002618 [Geodermatophilus bullaregiensis]|uniref:DUF2470 domain-containing protein n=1 Tax=Geodermatophilus bullaregiensis TaxID=1564160 RepID=UPI0019599F98|nr:DUF2470 domain-containing protein [Geodermatophilus bullaregiensis]MBM7806781.1 hypothetical protein [Geodermatophilus bullaregiensis]
MSTGRPSRAESGPGSGAGGTGIPQPPPAERARTVAARASATLHAVGVGAVALSVAGTTAAGQVLVVVPADGRLAAALRTSPLGDLPARLTVVDRSPFAVRHPVRGQVELSGWLTPVHPADVQRCLLDLADVHPSDVLLDVGLRAVLLRLDLAEVLLTDAGTTSEVDPDDFAAARPDPLGPGEVDLATGHGEPLDRLLGRVQAWAGRRDDVRLLGLDRFGVRFRVEGHGSCYDLRVPFAEPLTTGTGLGAALDTLLTRGPA